MPDHARLVAATAANLAGWHDANVRSLGRVTAWTDGSWRSPDPIPAIFFSAIAVRPGADATTLAAGIPSDRWIAVSDPWSDLDLGDHGFAVDGQNAWMVRDAGDAAGTAPPVPSELTIDLVADDKALVDFESAESLGFRSSAPAPHTWHGAPVIGDARMRMWRGRVDGRTVATAMAFADAGVTGIYSVATHPELRRRGYGAAITWSALRSFPDLPAVLQPSEMAEPLYRRLGFERFTTFRSWVRDPATRRLP